MQKEMDFYNIKEEVKRGGGLFVFVVEWRYKQNTISVR